MHYDISFSYLLCSVVVHGILIFRENDTLKDISGTKCIHYLTFLSHIQILLKWFKKFDFSRNLPIKQTLYQNPQRDRFSIYKCFLYEMSSFTYGFRYSNFSNSSIRNVSILYIILHDVISVSYSNFVVHEILIFPEIYQYDGLIFPAQILYTNAVIAKYLVLPKGFDIQTLLQFIKF